MLRDIVAYCYVYCSTGVGRVPARRRASRRCSRLMHRRFKRQFDRIMRGAPPLVLFRVMAGNARAWEKFRAGSLLDRGPLSLREREIVIDRTCARTGCEYEWGVHVTTFAEAAHLTERDRSAPPCWRRHRRCWSNEEQALIAAVDALHERATLSDAEFAGAVGALRRSEDLRDHPAVRILSHRVVSRERAWRCRWRRRRHGFQRI